MVSYFNNHKLKRTLLNYPITEEILENSNVVIWAVKPQVFPVVIDGVKKNLNRAHLNKETLHISIMAGISLAEFKSQLQQAMDGTSESIHRFRAVRVMPNIASQVSCGVSGTDLKILNCNFTIIIITINAYSG